MDTLSIRIVTLEHMRVASSYGFGLNPEYGYEFWMKVGPDIIPEGDIRIIEFMGGTYAVARCDVQGNPGKNIPAAWKNLAQWCTTNNRRFGFHQPLESIISGEDNPDQLVLDLYCPIII